MDPIWPAQPTVADSDDKPTGAFAYRGQAWFGTTQIRRSHPGIRTKRRAYQKGAAELDLADPSEKQDACENGSHIDLSHSCASLRTRARPVSFVTLRPCLAFRPTSREKSYVHAFIRRRLRLAAPP